MLNMPILSGSLMVALSLVGVVAGFAGERR
jgi:hypothetical protein